jgi:hypothetical protein
VTAKDKNKGLVAGSWGLVKDIKEVDRRQHIADRKYLGVRRAIAGLGVAGGNKYIRKYRGKSKKQE